MTDTSLDALRFSDYDESYRKYLIQRRQDYQGILDWLENYLAIHGRRIKMGYDFGGRKKLWEDDVVWLIRCTEYGIMDIEGELKHYEL